MQKLQNFKPDGNHPIRLFALLHIRIARAAATLALALSIAVASAHPYPLIRDYCDLLVTYACHAKTLWHDAPEGGYWGDGFDAKNKNGAVRGNCNTLFTYAILVRGLDSDWIQPDDVQKLNRAGLDRHSMVKYIRHNLAYLAAHHKSAEAPATPQWGYHWQSSLWMQSLGPAVLLTWNHLGNELKQEISRVAAAEAEWVASRPPKSQSPGNTGAEENAWDTAAPAVALAISPDSTSATIWWKTLKSYSANTFSHPSDRDSTEPIGSDVVGEIVTTANVNSDWSLLNHGFFHPDYVQVSGQHLGEAWIILSLGDAIHGTHMADQYVPYSLHNVEETWERVLRPLLLPTGEFAFPGGNDWTFHCSTNQAYFAFIATALKSYDAAQAESRGIEHVLARREAGPPGRILGDSNLEWWWEPLVCKRMSTALLHHVLRPGIISQPAIAATVDRLTTTVQLSDAKIWWHRTPHYFFSVSYGKPQMGYFVPLGGYGESAPYTTLPGKHSVLPEHPWEFRPEKTDGHSEITGGTFWRDDTAIGAVLCMSQSVAVLSRDGFHSMRVENDTLTQPGRTVSSQAGERFFPMLEKTREIWFPGPWITIDNEFGLIATDGFVWRPGCGWSQRSVAVDKVKPRANAGVWQMLTASESDTRNVAKTFAEEIYTTGILAIIKDGPDVPADKGMPEVTRRRYRVRLTDEGFRFKVLSPKHTGDR